MEKNNKEFFEYEQRVHDRFQYDINKYTGLADIIKAIGDVLGNKSGFAMILVDPFQYRDNLKTILINIQQLAQKLFTWDVRRFKEPLDQYAHLDGPEGFKEMKKILWRKLEHYEDVNKLEKEGDETAGLTKMTLLRIEDRLNFLQGAILKTGKIHRFEPMNLPEF